MQDSKYENAVIVNVGENRPVQLRVYKFADYCDIHFCEGNYIIHDNRWLKIIHILTELCFHVNQLM